MKSYLYLSLLKGKDSPIFYSILSYFNSNFIAKPPVRKLGNVGTSIIRNILPLIYKRAGGVNVTIKGPASRSAKRFRRYVADENRALKKSQF